MSREAWVVVDLGFGDAGKGSITDFLVRDRAADLVVRFNGGAQAGHNVVDASGRHHTFSQFTAGLLAGAPGVLGPEFVLHPLGMWVEAQHLASIGVRDPWARTEVHERARLITPYQQAANHARELLRGDRAHGTCGVGVGECVGDSLRHDTLHARDLRDRRRLRQVLRRQRERKRHELLAMADGAVLPEEILAVFDDDDLIDRVLTAWTDVGDVLQVRDHRAVTDRISAARAVVFEGAQGVLLDETWGFHPHTTWSDCTPRGARVLAGDRAITTVGVTRSYTVRHGHGPLPTAQPNQLDEPHNHDSGWQGRFRRGALDAVLLRYAVAVCGGIDEIAVTCLDQRSRGSTCDAYRHNDALVRDLPIGSAHDLVQRERLTRWLGEVEPVCADRDVLEFVAESVHVPVTLESWGPTAAGKRWV